MTAVNQVENDGTMTPIKRKTTVTVTAVSRAEKGNGDCMQSIKQKKRVTVTAVNQAENDSNDDCSQSSGRGG